MKIITSYNVRLKTEYISSLKQTVMLYTDAVRFYMDVILEEWNTFAGMSTNETVLCAERLSHATTAHPVPKYDFDNRFPKFPCYLRRAAISCAFGKCCAYNSSLANWKKLDPAVRKKAPGRPRITMEMPAFYKGNMFLRTGNYTARLKLFFRNDWQYVDVGLRKCDVDYLLRHCGSRKESSPVLRHCHKVWELCFSYEEDRILNKTPVSGQRILAVDLGIHNPCTCCVMNSDGTVLGRHFHKAPVEEDSLNHKLGKIKKAQRHGSQYMPKKWASIHGINTSLSRKTADFIISMAVLYNVDVIVMEHLDTSGKKRGSGKQRLHMWRKAVIWKQTELQAHRLGIRVSRVCAYNTSKLAFDGSGRVLRGREADLGSYSVCQFQTGKIYNCDLNASYNIGARYFIRELLKPFSEKEKLPVLAKVPDCGKRSTCTLASLIRLNAALAA
ncbi:transposase [Clostridium sp. AF34-10BH]|uniref:transposase n=1 Tax=Clostridium sp. AF34-10BH TaxID=2293011 RepID=UPI000E4F031C|nr:transposase [Clostridium sp. AF34-10BH]RHP33042.1 transposase [Clostridium sp. AF34-10BH]